MKKREKKKKHQTRCVLRTHATRRCIVLGPPRALKYSLEKQCLIADNLVYTTQIARKSCNRLGITSFYCNDIVTVVVVMVMVVVVF